MGSPGFVVAPVVWAAVAGYWLAFRPRLVASGHWPSRSPGLLRLIVGLEVGVSLVLVGLGGALAASVFPSPHTVLA